MEASDGLVVRLESLGDACAHATVTRILVGSVERVAAFSAGSETLHETLAVHRRIPGLLVQEVRVHASPTRDLLLHPTRASSWRMATPPGGSRLQEAEARTASGAGVRLLSPLLPTSVAVPRASRRSFLFRTLLRPSSWKRGIEEEQEWREERDPLASHARAWRSLWSAGFSVAPSVAEGALNGDEVNATLYLLMTHARTSAASHSSSQSSQSSQQPQPPLSDHCYAGAVPTLLAPRGGLWPERRGARVTRAAVARWLLTLEQHGCRSLVASGAEGSVQAALLSLLALSLQERQLEARVQPPHLDREMQVRALRAFDARLDVGVTLHESDGRASLRLRASDASRPLFACDAGCLDPPIQVTRLDSLLPVKETQPPTPVLYVSPEATHLRRLRDALHVHEVALAPAQDLSRHRRQLPPLFWAAIAALVAVFHVFLFKLVYTELVSPSGGRSR